MERTPPPEGGESEARTERRGQRFHFGPWVFDVDLAKGIIAETPREVIRLPVKPWTRFYGLDTPDGQSFSLFRPLSTFDRDYALTTGLADPLIVATLQARDGERFPLLIDGTHRLYRGLVEGVADLPAHVLTMAESLSIREDGYYR